MAKTDPVVHDPSRRIYAEIHMSCFQHDFKRPLPASQFERLCNAFERSLILMVVLGVGHVSGACTAIFVWGILK